QYNAAVGQSLGKEAAQIKTDLDYLDGTILARQSAVVDPAKLAADEEIAKLQANASELADDVAQRKQRLPSANSAQLAAATQPAANSASNREKAIERKAAELAAAEKSRADA